MTSSFGKLFTVTSYGESHGSCIGVVIDGCPAGLELSESEIQKELDRRRPSNNIGSTTRFESDIVEIFSGVFKSKTTGAPIMLLIRNTNQESGEYERNRFIPRPGHADYTAYLKYGGFNDYRGGGRFSGRVSAGFVMAGAIAKNILATIGVEIVAHTIQIGQIKAPSVSIDEIRKNAEKSILRCANEEASRKMSEVIQKVREEGDSLGGIIEAIAIGVPSGMGEPLFDTVEGEIAKAMFAIPAVKGVEFGAGFRSASMLGSENNDQFEIQEKRISTTSNTAGGISGGISNGMPIVVRVAVKPTPSIAKEQHSIDLSTMKEVNLVIKGRHDTCIVPRAVPVVESMIAITLTDFALRAGKITGVIK